MVTQKSLEQTVDVFNHNLLVVDFFDLLAEGNPDPHEYNMLQAAYQRGGGDSHPNRHANEVIGPQLVKFVIEAVETFRTAHR